MVRAGLPPKSPVERAEHRHRRVDFVGTATISQSNTPMIRRKRWDASFIDCRAFPSEMNCTIALSADSEAELLEAAVQHAVAVHKHQDTPDLRQMIKSTIKDGTPPIEPPPRTA